MRKISCVLCLLLVVSIATCKNVAKKSIDGKVMILVGSATMENNGVTKPLKSGDSIMPGTIVKTENNSTVIIAFEKIASVEVQSNSVFKVDLFANKLQSITLQEGNLWLQVHKKLAKSEQFNFTTPSAVAAIRGTKLFSFKLNDMQGTCHCQGKVDYTSKGNKYHAVHKTDYMTFTRGDKTILLTPKDMLSIGIQQVDHNHSQIDNSPLGGKKKAMSKNIKKKFLALIEKKFKEVK